MVSDKDPIKWQHPRLGGNETNREWLRVLPVPAVTHLCPRSTWQKVRAIPIWQNTRLPAQLKKETQELQEKFTKGCVVALKAWRRCSRQPQLDPEASRPVSKSWSDAEIQLFWLYRIGTPSPVRLVKRPQHEIVTRRWRFVREQLWWKLSY